MQRNRGEAFPEYEPLEVAHISIPKGSTDARKIADLGAFAPDAAAEILPEESFALAKRSGKPTPLLVVRAEDASSDLGIELRQPLIEVAPAADVYRIPPDQPDLAKTIKATTEHFDYYLAELGLNVATGREAKVPALLFRVNLWGDTQERTDVTAFDVMPKDEVKEVQIVGGKISVGLTKALELVAGPVGKLAAQFLTLELNPWEFSWKYKRYMIDVSGTKNYHVLWKIYKTDRVQSFNPTLVLKVRKGVKAVRADVRAVYELQTRWFRRVQAETKTRTVKLWPP